jgi:hypothetical protein
MYDTDVDIARTLVICSSGFIGKYFLKYYKNVYPDTLGLDINPSGKDCIKFDMSSLSIKETKIKNKGYRNAMILAGITKVSTCER